VFIGAKHANSAISRRREDIANMSGHSRRALRKLGLVDRNDPAAMAVAKLIMEFAKAGQRDPDRLCALALGAIKVKDPRNLLGVRRVF
jgi:hypothetical protein